jgi:hypothetical protein
VSSKGVFLISNYLQQSRTLEEVYALIDKSRFDAAKAAQTRFHGDVEAAIASIASIGSIAGARVLADSRVASANVLINAELAATRLLAEAEMQASQCANQVLTKPPEVVEAALLEIGKSTTLRLVTTATALVEKIRQDAEAAIKVLRETGANAIREIHALAATVAEQTKRDAELAAEKLKEYRKSTHTMDEAANEGDDAAKIVVQAAEEASAKLQEAIKTTLAEINAVTDQACAVVREAALAAEKKIREGQERALIRLKEALHSYL